VFVWVWLPGRAEPVVAGRLRQHSESLIIFTYGRSYLDRADAMALYLPELPLRRGVQRPPTGMDVAGCVRDAAPDAWGQRVILRRLAGRSADGGDTAQLPLLTYLLASGSDRAGALDFQRSATEYVPRDQSGTLEELLSAKERFEAGALQTTPLDDALLRGSSIGGARPKATLVDGDRSLIAKFSSWADPFPVVKAEAVAMDLARQAGLSVARTELVEVMGRDVLLVDRFDREAPRGPRRMFVSALTILGLHEDIGRYATYFELADQIRARFTDRAETLRELFSRITFNILVGNTDDHARNHAAFWDGEALTLTPAYDICPQLRSGGEAAQAMAIRRDGFRMAQLAGCVAGAREYELTERQARDIIDEQVDTIREHWGDAAERARLTAAERDLLWGRQILNPYAFHDHPTSRSPVSN
jgi:serine/threonine-protein kinase HipA